MYVLLIALLVLDSVILTTAILFQAGQGGGLASLGGGAGTETFMGGRQATTLLTKTTWTCAAIFLFLSLVLEVMAKHRANPSSILQGGAPVPAQTQQPALPLQPAPQQTPPATPRQTPNH
ncbi:MAG TPA: preprotein translocase subunit SecG [Gemmatimonadales bacterium]|nr:preprotein translocase subunit SecG [Gemmatimonadales bacterium]